jgi:hypothetical protein
MMHEHIWDHDAIERYVRHQLSPDQELAFEEHFFSCDECFEKLKEMERFVAGMRDAGHRGHLDSPDPAIGKKGSRWLLPGLAAGSCSAVVLAGLVLWAFFILVPGFRHERDEALAKLSARQELQADLESAVGQERATQANVPFVMLESTRGNETSEEATLPSGARHLIIWAELPRESRFQRFRMEVYAPDRHLIEVVKDLTRNSYGAVVVNLASEGLSSGDYVIKLSGVGLIPPIPLAEYHLKINRR